MPATSPTAVATHVHVRPISTADRDALAHAFAGLSDESRRLRFLGPKARLTDAELTYFTDVDHHAHEALVAVDAHDGSLIAVARYAPYPDHPGVADLAVVVADAWQGLGIGTRLCRELVARAVQTGRIRLTASTLVDNRRARRLLRGLGFRSSGFDADVLELALDLR